jgi:hypothetical protein
VKGGGSLIPESMRGEIEQDLLRGGVPLWDRMRKTPAFARYHVPYGTPMRRPEELSLVANPVYQHGMAMGDGTVLILDDPLNIISTTSGWEMNLEDTE